MEFNVAEDLLGDFISYRAVEGDEHGLGEGGLHEALDGGIVIADKRLEVTGFRTETKGYGEFEEKPQMEVAEVVLHGVQQEDVPFAPFIETLFCRTFLDDPVEDFAHEHGHGVLEDVAADSEQRVSGSEIAGSEES